ncbi:MAG: hypothetical protein V2I33_13035 [Kangiellaceae bacterium]|jgi:hypothetical protein|nr:hypothetical protein [Kangiellaceae bacterium]
MSNIELIQNTPSDELVKKHLKVVFDTYYQLFGEVCTGCPTKIAGYIQRIKNLKNKKVMAKDKRNFNLKKGTIIPIPGTSKVYSDANLTDDIAIQLLKANPNRRVLFSKLPENLEDLLSENDDTVLSELKVSELRERYPEAKGKNKSELIKSIEDIIASKQANADSEEDEEGVQSSDEEE